ncbi:MAG: sugar transferase [Actinobacteria bacterium]|nr:sugar transferase [Actinomycetota bacterium]
MTRLARPLAAAGSLVAVVAFSLLHARANGYDWVASSRFAWSLSLWLLLLVVSYGQGIPDLVRRRKAAWAAATSSVVVSVGIISFIQLWVGDALLPRAVVLGVAATSVPWFVFCSRLARTGELRAEDRDRVLVVADRSEVALLADELALHPERSASVVGDLHPAEARAQGGGERPLCAAAARNRASVIVLCREAQDDETIVAQAAELHAAGARVRTLSMFYEGWLGKLPLGELERVSLLFDIGDVHRARYQRLKRLLDIGFGLAGLVVLAALVPFVVLGDLAANRGTLLYRQERVGRRGTRFTILKLRTMRVGTDSSWTSEDDPRITPFGRFLRRTHLDELPQVVNILRGDLSVVGPRPEQPRYVTELVEKLPFYDVRHLVRPGLTGWAQVKYGYAGDEHDALEKLQYEFFYLRHQSLTFDLRVMGRTLRSIVRGAGR